MLRVVLLLSLLANVVLGFFLVSKEAPVRAPVTSAAVSPVVTTVPAPPTPPNGSSVPPEHSQPVSASVVTEPPTTTERSATDRGWLSFAVDRRIREIENIVPLDDATKRRLEEKFQKDLDAFDKGEETASESLSDILGADRADEYQRIREAAYQSLRNERVEKELFFLSRKLRLSGVQEQGVQQALSQFEETRSELFRPMREMAEGQGAANREQMLNLHQEAQERMEENRERLRENLKQILSPEQYADYLAREANSPSRILQRNWGG